MKRKLQIAVFVFFAGLAVITLLPRLFTAQAEIDSNNEPETKENLPPEIADLHHYKIGLGQRYFFGVEVIDEENDNVRIELVEKPKSAKFDQNTLTVDWTPQKSDGKIGKFVVKVTELPRDKSRQERTVTKDYNVEIVDKPVKLLELPETTLEVDAFVSIIDPERLKAADKKWNMISLFQRIGEIEAEKQIKAGSDIQPSTGEQLFRDSMKELAIMHKNPTLDPDSPKFDKVWNAENWHLIAVRPRINKKIFELRLVYFNTVAAEQAYLMPRMRIVRAPDTMPEELRQKNNYQFAKMFHEAFFDGENMKPFVANDKAKYGEALAEFMTKVLTYNDPNEPLMKANLAAIPHNSRLGGGNEYDEKGNYLFGDGWALGAMTVKPVMKNGKNILTVVSPPIAGFVASIKPNADNTAYKPVPAPITRKGDPAYREGWENAIDEAHSTVFIPEVMPDGTVARSNIDTQINSFDYKTKYMVAETSLDDPRRRLFEEKGMTCIQCHVRNFDEGDYLVSVQEPGKIAEDVQPRPIKRVFFIITPTLHSGRNEYIHREEQEQVGNLQGVFRDYLGVQVRMASPLSLDWVHGTKKGRS